MRLVEWSCFLPWLGSRDEVSDRLVSGLTGLSRALMEDEVEKLCGVWI